MADLNRYPNYIGVDAELTNSAIIKLKYTGEASKSVVVTCGSLVSVGHTVNKNGVLSYELSMGIVNAIGSDPVRRDFPGNYLISQSKESPYYLVIDKSNTYASDIITVYLKDIRDIIVGPMAEGNFAKGEMSGDTLPEVNDANKDLYLGRFFYLKVITDDIGLYYYNETGWMRITTADNLDSSPLITTLTISGEKKYIIKDTIILPGSIVSNVKLISYTFNVTHSNDSYIKVCLTGNIVNYQLHLTETSLLSDSSGDEIAEIEIASLSGDIDNILPPHETSINVNRVNVNGEWKDVYHRITPEGKLRVAYPNVPGITTLDLFGSYIV